MCFEGYIEYLKIKLYTHFNANARFYSYFDTVARRKQVIDTYW